MNESPDLTKMRRIQFMAANYTRLQGLRGLPIGMLTFLVALWANFDRGPAPRPILPYLLFAILALASFFLINRYYHATFGSVVGAPRGHSAWLIELVGGGAGLLAFLLDIRYALPVSLTGLVFTAAMLADYLFLVGITRVWYMPFMPVFPLLVALLSISPLFGLGAWWEAIGFRAEIVAVVMAAGLMILLSSLISHLYLIHTLPGKHANGSSI